MKPDLHNTVAAAQKRVLAGAADTIWLYTEVSAGDQSLLALEWHEELTDKQDVFKS